MKTLTVAVGALILGLATGAAAEPMKLDDRALDSVTAGAIGGIALGFNLGTYSTGRTGAALASTYGGVLVQQQIVNGVASSSTQAAASSTFSAFGSGPGATSAGGVGGVFVSVF